MPNRQAHLRRARHWIVNRGWRGFLEEVVRRIGLKLRGEPPAARPGPVVRPHPFDLAHGVDTTGLVWGEALEGKKIKPDAQYWATGYYGVAPSALHAALDRLNLDWRQFRFVDIGCGKGRAMLLALRYPFKGILGIELSPALADIARSNLASFQAPWRQGDVPAAVLTGDATAFELPCDPMVLFLYHPFAAPVMRRFLQHLEQSLHADPRPVYLLYANPELAPMLDGNANLQQLSNVHYPFSAEDTAADLFGSHSEHIITYRTRNSGLGSSSARL